jgi:hypothetical protein
MGHSHTIIPYKSINEDDKSFEFGMSQKQVAAQDAKIYEVKEDNTCDWILERRGGYSTEFVNGKLVAVAFRIDPGYNSFKVDKIDISDKDGVEKLKRKHEHYIFSNGESVLFPTLGFLVSVTPFCDGWDPRPGVFNKEIIAFSKERLEYYRLKSQVISLQPLKGISIAGENKTPFAIPPKQVHGILGKPEYSWKNYGSHNHIVEYYFNHGFCLRYRKYEASYRYSENMPLHSIEVMEKNGWQVEADGIFIFNDDKLAQMKSKYKYIESKKKKAVAFPTLGIFTLGCGEKKNSGKGAEGKAIFLYNKEAMDSKIPFIDMWD